MNRRRSPLAWMRGEMVSKDIFDLAVKARDAFRRRTPAKVAQR